MRRPHLPLVARMLVLAVAAALMLPVAQPAGAAESPAPRPASPSAERAVASASASQSASASSRRAPKPVVRGERLVDARTGDRFVPNGVNQPGFEYLCRQGYGYMYGATAKAARAMQRWHVTTVRLGLNQDCWLGLQGAPANVDGGSSTVEGYRQAVEHWVDTLNRHGIVAVLTLGWSAPEGSQAFSQRPMPDAQSLDFWSSVAERFADHPSVIFDAYGEPYSRFSGTVALFDLTWQCWSQGGCAVPDANLDMPIDESTPRYEAVGMTQLVAAIRAAGATQPVMLPGIDWANDVRGWRRWAPDDDQLIASWHAYPDGRCNTRACWSSDVAPLARHVPVVIAETGQLDGGSDRVAALARWAADERVGLLQWAWWQLVPADDYSTGRYELFGDVEHYDPKAGPGAVLFGHLAAAVGHPLERAEGRFESGRNASVRYRGSLARGDEVTAVLPVRVTTGRGSVRVRIVATDAHGQRRIESVRVPLIDVDRPIAVRLTAAGALDRIRVEVEADSKQSKLRYGSARVIRVRG